MRATILVLAAATGIAGSASADPTPPSGASRIVRPDWVAKPSQDDMRRAYPNGALRRNQSGYVRIRCNVTVAGEAVDCQVLSEDPAGAGFGEAALQLSHQFRFRPQIVDGVPVGGASVVVPVRFEPSSPAWFDRLQHRKAPARPLEP